MPEDQPNCLNSSLSPPSSPSLRRRRRRCVVVASLVCSLHIFIVVAFVCCPTWSRRRRHRPISRRPTIPLAPHRARQQWGGAPAGMGAERGCRERLQKEAAERGCRERLHEGWWGLGRQPGPLGPRVGLPLGLWLTPRSCANSVTTLWLGDLHP